MNTTAISSSHPASIGSTNKSVQMEHGGVNSKFEQVLSREINERQTAKNSGSSSPQESASSEKTAADSAQNVDEPSHEASKVEEGALSAADQMLAIAMQLSSMAETTVTSSAGTTSAGLPGDNSGSSLTPFTESAQATSPKLQQIITEDAAKSPGTTPRPSAASTQTENRFETLLRQPSDSRFSADADTFTAPSEFTVDRAGLEALTSHIQLAGVSADSEDTLASDLSAVLAPLQQAAGALSQSANAKTVDRIAPHVGTSAWNQAIGQKVVWMIGAEQQTASLTLNPPDLGPLHVVLNVSNTQASASFYASQPEVRQAIETALPKLREMMGDAGIQLGQTNVSAGTPQQHGTYEGPTPAPLIAPVQNADMLSVSAQTNNANNNRIARNGLIDTFA